MILLAKLIIDSIFSDVESVFYNKVLAWIFMQQNNLALKYILKNLKQKKITSNAHCLPLQAIPFFSLQFLWDIIDIPWRCTTCWFETLTNCNMITIIALANVSITSNGYISILWWQHLRSTLRNFQVYSTIWLSITTVLCTRYPELTHLLTGDLYSLTNISLPSTILLVSASMSWAFIDCTYEGYHKRFPFL